MADSLSLSSIKPNWVPPVLVTILFINFLVLIPGTLRYMYRMWSFRRESYIRARGPHLTLLFACSLLLIITLHPIILVVRFWFLDPNSLSIHSPLHFAIHLVAATLGIVPSLGVAVRLHLVFHHLKYHEAIFKKKRIGLHSEKNLELTSKVKISSSRSPDSIPDPNTRQSVSPFTVNGNHELPPTSPLTLQSSQQLAIDNVPSSSNTPNEVVSCSPASSAVTVASSTSTSFPNVIQIDSKMANPLQFWIDYRKSLGSPSWMTKLVLLLFLFDAALITLTLLCTPLYAPYCIQCALCAVLLLFVHFEVRNMSPVRDEFFVRKQFRNELVVLYGNAALWTITLSLWIVFKDDDGDQIANDALRIAVHFLMDGNQTATALLLIVAQMAIPLFRFEHERDRLSNRNLFCATKSARRRLKVSMFECIIDRDGYYLFMEHLMGEYSVENLLFLTEVAFMKQKFKDSKLVISDGDARSTRDHSVSSSIKNAFHGLSDRRVSAESGNESAGSTPPPQRTMHRSLASRSRKSTGGRVSMRRLRTIESSKAIVSTKLEVEEIMSLSAEDLEEKSKSRESPSLSSAPTPELGLELPTIEMAVINGKSLTFDGDLFRYPLRDRGDGADSKTVRLPELPHTLTLAESMKQDNLYDAVDMIYDNFICRKATHQINISSGVWLEITRVVIKHRAAVDVRRRRLSCGHVAPSETGSIDPAGVRVDSEIDVDIFDEASSEIMALLRSSFFRFAQTKRFKVYCAALGKL